jgi:hypothetical protein
VVSISSKQPARPWHVIAEEITHANRGDRIVELAEELERAFDEQMPGMRKSPQVAPSEDGNKPELNPQQRKQS